MSSGKVPRRRRKRKSSPPGRNSITRKKYGAVWKEHTRPKSRDSDNEAFRCDSSLRSGICGYDRKKGPQRVSVSAVTCAVCHRTLSRSSQSARPLCLRHTYSQKPTRLLNREPGSLGRCARPTMYGCASIETSTSRSSRHSRLRKKSSQHSNSKNGTQSHKSL